jgi:plastocyanin
VFLGGAAVALALVHRAGAPPVVVHVTMEDYRFVLSRQHVPVGTVRFVVVNRGATVHDFAIGRARTRLLGPGQQQALVVHFPRAARMPYRCTVAGHAALGMKGTLVVGKPKPAPPPGSTATTPRSRHLSAGRPDPTVRRRDARRDQGH